MIVIRDFVRALPLLAETGLLLYLWFKVIGAQKREHLLWIGLMLAGRLVSLVSIIYYVPASLYSAAHNVFVVTTAVNWVGRCIEVVGMAALVKVVSRLILRSDPISRPVDDQGTWPPAPGRPQ